MAIVIGVAVILQSLITDYEFSIANVLPLSMHLAIDVVAGIVLALSPVIFGFTDAGTNAWLPHVLAGLGLIGAGMMTTRERDTPREGTHRPRHTTAH